MPPAVVTDPQWAVLSDRAAASQNQTSCPRCAVALATEEGHRPWCERCEWRLDDFSPIHGLGRFTNWVLRLDCRAGFRADRRLTEAYPGDDDKARRIDIGESFLVLVSAVLVVGLLALLALGVWLVVASGFLPAMVLGLLLIAAAYALRPRIGSVRRFLDDCYELSPTQAPALHALINEVAERTEAPAPEIVALDMSWNAGVTTLGVRRTRIMVLGVPLLLALRRQQVVALIGHELGHFRYLDNRRNLLTQPARTTFGRLAAALRPPVGDAHDRGFDGLMALAFTVWQVIARVLSSLLFLIHLGLNAVAADRQRRAELRADLLSARAAGTTAALETIDQLTMLPLLTPVVGPNGNAGQAMAQWRAALDLTRDRHQSRLARLRQLTCRDAASLFASHPAPGRRHQLLAGRPYQDAAVRVTEGRADLIDAELAPYVEALRKRLADAYEL